MTGRHDSSKATVPLRDRAWPGTQVSDSWFHSLQCDTHACTGFRTPSSPFWGNSLAPAYLLPPLTPGLSSALFPDYTIQNVQCFCSDSVASLASHSWDLIYTQINPKRRLPSHWHMTLACIPPGREVSKPSRMQVGWKPVPFEASSVGINTA